MKKIRTGVVQPLPGIGDMIWYLPALKAIAASAPDGQITLFTRASSQANQVLAAESMVAEIIYLPVKRRGILAVMPNLFRTWLALFRSRPDRLFILHQSFRYRLAARLAGIRKIISYPRGLASSKDDGWKKSLLFLQQQGVPVSSPHSFLAVDEKVVETMSQRFDDRPKPWIVIAPGASTPARLWPGENFAFCADRLIEATGGTVFMVGSQRETESITHIRGLCQKTDKIVPVIGLPFDQVMGLIFCSSCLLGNDSGPANVAAALGRLAFSLCGTSTPPLHSPNLHLITADLPQEVGTGMEYISAKHAIKTIFDIWKTSH